MDAKATKLLQKAKAEAEMTNDGHVGVEHVFLAATKEEGDFLSWLEQRWGVFPYRLRELLIARIGKGLGTRHFMPYSMRLKGIVDQAAKSAGGSEKAGVEHLFHAILSEGESLPAKILKEDFRLDCGEVAKSWLAEGCGRGVVS